MEVFLYFAHDDKTDDLVPYSFDCFNFKENIIEFNCMLDAEYETKDLSFEYRFPPGKVKEFYDQMTKAYKNLHMQFMKYVTIEGVDWQ